MKFSILTPTYNSERYIRETIDSVIKQKGDFSIEYIVRDNRSTDRTCAIVSEYQELLSAGKIAIHCHGVHLSLYSDHDSGMYDAIKRGFSQATGDIFAWINSDDIYLPGAFDIVQRTLEAFPEISWLKGITSYINENSTIYAVGKCNLYRQDWIQAGLYGPVLHFIQQDSVFWRANLWHVSGGVDSSLSLAGDYFLWKSFAEYSPMYSLDAYVSCFRRVPNQKSADIETYFREINRHSKVDGSLVTKIKRYRAHIESVPRFLRPLCYRLVWGRQACHLVKLKDGLTPCLMVGEPLILQAMM